MCKKNRHIMSKNHTDERINYLVHGVNTEVPDSSLLLPPSTSNPRGVILSEEPSLRAHHR